MNKEEFYSLVPRTEIERLAESCQTPGYVYFRSVIASQISKLTRTLPSQFDLHYALKANPNALILSELSSRGIGADVASEGELKKALEARFPPEKIEFSGPGKRESELKLAVENGVASINIENIDEVSKIVAICRSIGKSANVGIRLNPVLEAERSGMRMAGDTPFGLKVEDAEVALKLIHEGSQFLNFTGFHAHLASQELDAGKLVAKYAVVIRHVLDLMENSPLKLKKINFGGGLGITYFSNQSDLDLTLLASGLRELIASPEAKQLPHGVQFIIEPGRYIVGESGVFLTQILYRKRSLTKEFLITDGGLNANYVLAGGMGQVIRRNFELDLLTKNREANPLGKYDIAGPLCTPQDIIARDVEGTASAREGDYVVFFNCGAYGPTASPTNFLSQRAPSESII